MQNSLDETSSHFLNVPIVLAQVSSEENSYVEQKVGSGPTSVVDLGARRETNASQIFEGPASSALSSGGWRTYNFEVADHHTYVADSIRVHNNSYIQEQVHVYSDGSSMSYGMVSHHNDFDKVTTTYNEHGHITGKTYSFISEEEDGTFVGHQAGDTFGEYNYSSGSDVNVSATGAGIRPIVLDLDGDGVEITVGQQIFFDMDSDGYLEQTSWASANDGFLVIDLNADGSFGSGDGHIDQSNELILSLWGNEGDTDLQALGRAFDDNENGNGVADGVIDEKDSVWTSLRVWQDIDQDGITDKRELFVLAGVQATAWYDENGDGIETQEEIHTLEQLATGAITSIALTYNGSTAQTTAEREAMFADESNDISIFGSTLHGLASYTKINTDGSEETVTGGVGDVSLSAAILGWRKDPTSFGYKIEFETGATYNYAVLEGSGTTSVNLVDDWLDGATGDDRNNFLDARWHSRAVQITGGIGADVIYGGQLDDMLSGDDGADHLLGYGGNDVIFFDEDDTIVRGGSGHDIAIYTGTSDLTFELEANEFEVAYGGDGNDVLNAGYADKLTGKSVALHGGAGNDELNAGGGNDILSGDAGNDIANAGEGDDVLVGGLGADTLRGENGSDLILGDDGNDNLNGGTGDDVLSGGEGNDLLWGDSGDDLLQGGEGFDSLHGADGDDRIFGGNHRDTLIGQNGDDSLYGGDGHDVFHGGYGDDYAEGGTGNDLFHDSYGDDFYRGQEGDDVFSLTIYGGNNVVQGGVGTDKVMLSGSEAQWEWRYVEDNGQGIGQYLFWSGATYLQIQDVEQVQFIGNGNTTYWSHLNSQSSEEFSLAYIASSNDLINSLGNNANDGSIHWLHYGQGENRDVSFNAMKYLAANSDVYIAYGFDLSKAAEHYILDGRDQGRSKGNFNAEQYLRNYADLRGAFGPDLSAATEHFIRAGRQEGRTDVAIGGAMSATQWEAWLQSNAGDGSIITLDHVNAATEHEDTFYWANYIDETDPNAVIYGWQGTANTLNGGSGNDEIVADASGSNYYLGTIAATIGRNDTVNGGDGADTVSGGIGSDSLNGGHGGDVLFGDSGDDTLNGGSGADFIRGGDGNDSLSGNEGADTLEGGEGSDRLLGGDGNDVLLGGNGNDSVSGNMGSDYISGGVGNDTIHAGQAADTVDGGDGDDLIYAGVGSDFVTGGAGADTIDGSNGDDRLYGNDGNDRLFGGAGNDLVDAGSGDDSLTGSIGLDALYGGDGNDTLLGEDDNDILAGGAGIDQLFGGNENDVLNGGEAGDTLDGGAGIDTASYADATSGVYLSLANVDAAQFTGEASGDVFVSVENAYGSIHNDRLYGTGGHNVLWGADGADKILGRSGNDDLFGGAGSDTIYGEAGIDLLEGGDGNDFLLGGEGSDQLIGGEGIDRAQYSSAATALIADLQMSWLNTGEASGDTYDSIENLYGSNHGDQLRGDADANQIWGHGGHDYIHGRAGDDTIYGNDGNDVIYGGSGANHMYGGAGTDRAQYYVADSAITADLQYSSVNTGVAAGDSYDSIENLHGGGGDDTLRGDAGNNTVWGGLGNDQVQGRLGNDLLVGQAGEDQFYFNPGWDQDTIHDYEDNVDTIIFRQFGFANVQDALSNASQAGSHVLFDFGEGDTLMVLNATMAMLADDVLLQ